MYERSKKDSKDHGGEKVTLYAKGGFGNIVKIEARLHETGLRNRTTYATKSVPYAVFTPKRKRKERAFTVTERDPFLLILKGWGGPDPAGIFGEETKDPKTGVTTRHSTHVSFDPAFRSDFDALIDPLLESGAIEVILDVRDDSSFSTPVEEDAPEPGKIYALTAFASGGPSIANGNTWAESVVGT